MLFSRSSLVFCFIYSISSVGFPGGSMVRSPPVMQMTWLQSLHWEDPLEKGKVARSNILACTIPWILESMGSQRVGHD